MAGYDAYRLISIKRFEVDCKCLPLIALRTQAVGVGWGWAYT